MSNLKYMIPEISALDIISSAEKTEDGYRFYLDTTDPSKEYMCENTLQDDCSIFYQAMSVLEGEHFRVPDYPCDKLRDVLVYIDFSSIFDRRAVVRVAKWQEIAENMFKPDGITLNFGKQDMRYIAFERSASMSRGNSISFLREDVYAALKERMTLGMNIGNCQLSKLYAYNALLFTSGTRFEDNELLSEQKIIVIDNPKSIVPNVNTVTVEDDDTDNAMRKYTRVERKADVEITEFDGEGLISPRLAERIHKKHNSLQIRLPYIKGVVHKVDFAALLDELGVPFIVDIFGNQLNPKDVDIILTKSMFKGFGWMQENGIPWSEYLQRC